MKLTPEQHIHVVKKVLTMLVENEKDLNNFKCPFCKKCSNPIAFLEWYIESFDKLMKKSEKW